MSKVEPTDFVSAGSAGRLGIVRASSLPPPPPQLEDLNSSRPVLITGFIGGLLNMIAGYMNAVCLVAFGSSATHATGATTKAGIALVGQHLNDFTRYALSLILFLAGACSISLIIGGRKKLVGGKHYSPVLALVGFVVFVAAAVGRMSGDRERASVLVCSLISYAAGAQNAMTAYFSGGIVRTTHVTGTVTDIGMEIATLILRRRWKDTWKLELFVCFFFAFFIGGVFGTIVAVAFPDWALFYPAGVFFSLSTGNYLYHHFSVPLVVETEASTSMYQLRHTKSGDVEGCESDEYGDSDYDLPVPLSASMAESRGPVFRTPHSPPKSPRGQGDPYEHEL